MTYIKEKMTSKTTKVITMTVILTVAIIPNLFAAAETPNEMDAKIKERVPEELRDNVSNILNLAKQQFETSDASEKERLSQLIQAEKDQMSKINELRKAGKTVDSRIVAQLEAAKDLIYASDLPLVLSVVHGDKLVIMLQIGTEDSGLEEKIASILPAGIRTDIVYAAFEDWDCDSRADECNPLLGGLEIRKGGSETSYCTLGLPVKQGSQTGYLTSGHCYGVSDNVYQPYSHWFWNWKIGEVDSGDSINDLDCDCAFVTKTTSRNEESKVWMEYWYWTDITGTTVPDVNDPVTISGAAGDWYEEDVVSNNANIPGYFNGAILLTNSGFGGPGDSGAPVYDWANDDFVGIVKGTDTTQTYIVVVPWGHIADTTDGLGVSLL